jgi:hypothetical protein
MLSLSGVGCVGWSWLFVISRLPAQAGGLGVHAGVPQRPPASNVAFTQR